MRISTNQIYAQGTNNLLAQQAKLNQLQSQLSGTRVNTAADDPIASAQIQTITQRLNTTQIYQNNNQSLTSDLNLQDSVMSNVTANLQSLLTIQTQAQNGTLSQSDRSALGVQAQKILDQLVSYGNSTGISGQYIFGGSKTDTAPITKILNPSTGSYDYTYNGDNKQQFQPISDSLQVAANDPGDSLFMNIPAGNGRFAINQTANPNNGTLTADTGSVSDPAHFVAGNYTITANMPANTISVVDSSNNPVSGSPFAYQTGQAISFNGMSVTLSGSPADGQSFSLKTGKNDSLFTTVQKMVDNLNAPMVTTGDTAAIQTQNTQVMTQLKTALSHFNNASTDVGGRINQLTTTSAQNDSLNVINQQVISQLRDSDIISVSSQYQLQLTTLKAAQQSFVQIQGLSVFNYIA